MKFTPKSKEELTRLLPAGKYLGMIQSAEEKNSTNGNPMIVVKVEIYDSDGKAWFITDRLILMESMMWKLRAFCESADLMEAYEAGELTASICEGRSVNCTVVVKRDEGYDPKNEIKSYFVPKEKVAKKTESAAPRNAPVSTVGADGKPTVGPDDIPF